MAESYATRSDQEQASAAAHNNAARPAVIPSATPIEIYDRPEQSPRAAGALAGVILLALVLFVVAFFIFQWWR